VVDTKLARSQHEATWKHRSSIERQLRQLHRENEIKKREHQAAAQVLKRIESDIQSQQPPLGQYPVAAVQGFSKQSSAGPSPTGPSSTRRSLTGPSSTSPSSTGPSSTGPSSTGPSSNPVKDPTPEIPKKRVPIRTGRGYSDQWIAGEKILEGDVDVDALTSNIGGVPPNKPEPNVKVELDQQRDVKVEPSVKVEVGAQPRVKAELDAQSSFKVGIDAAQSVKVESDGKKSSLFKKRKITSKKE
jgi:hypothetical protein